MHILMLTWEYPPNIVGGISRVVYNLSKELESMGNKVTVFTCCESGWCEPEKDGGITVHRVNSYNLHRNSFTDWVMEMNFAMIEKAVSTGEGQKADLIHAHDWLVAYAARVLKHSFFKPLVSTIHATECGRNNGIYNDMQRYINSIEWWLTYESWRVIVNSMFMKGHVGHIFSLPQDKIDIVHNGINSKEFARYGMDMCFRRKYALDEEKIVFFIGRMVNEKGVSVLIDAVPIILKEYYNVKFVLAGKGPMLGYFKQKAWEAGVSEKIYFTGYLDDDELKRLYGCIDIMVVPSFYEPFGITVLEGMAAGVPVVASDCGGLDEIIEHGKDGLKCRSGDAFSLAGCILDILRNPEKSAYLCDNARIKIRNEYDWHSAAEKTLAIYRRVLEERKNTRWG